MIEWFTKDAGSPGVAQCDDDPSMVLVGDTTPDWVRMPPELGGAQARVLMVAHGACVCDYDHQVRHLGLDNGVIVAECQRRGYLWYKPRAQEDV